MSTTLLAALSALVATACALRVLIHAFGRSLGTGMIVLLVPAYLPVYAFSQFEHRRKGWIASGLLASAVLAAVFLAISIQRMVPVVPDVPPAPTFELHGP